MDQKRCSWASDPNNPLMMKYHDEEYGRMIDDNDKLFELFCLELLQTGLSWNIVLQKRAAFNEVFHNFKIAEVAQMQIDDVILTNAQLIRHKAKLEAIVNNAQVIMKQNLDLKDYVLNAYATFQDDFVKGAKQYKKDGFKFVGPSTIESLYLAIGLIQAHQADCFLYHNIKRK